MNNYKLLGGILIGISYASIVILLMLAKVNMYLDQLSRQFYNSFKYYIPYVHIILLTIPIFVGISLLKRKE